MENFCEQADRAAAEYIESDRLEDLHEHLAAVDKESLRLVLLIERAAYRAGYEDGSTDAHERTAVALT